MRTPGLLLSIFFLFSFPSETTAAGVPRLIQPKEDSRLYFIENKGQLSSPDEKKESEVLYMLRSPGLNIYVHRGGLIYQFLNTASEQSRFNATTANNGPAVGANSGIADHIQKNQDTNNKVANTKGSLTRRLAMDLTGANAGSLVQAGRQTPYFENYFGLPHAPEGLQNVRSFEKITLKEVYPNIDWILYIKEGSLKYDFIVHPGGNVGDIKMKYSGAHGIRVLPGGQSFGPYSFGAHKRREAIYLPAGWAAGNRNGNRIYAAQPGDYWL